MALQTRGIESCSSRLLTHLSEEIVDLDPLIYEGVDRNEILHGVSEALRNPQSDLGAGSVVFRGCEPVGYISAYPYEEKQARNIVSLLLYNKNLSRMSAQKLKENLARFKSIVREIESDCLYLDKIILFRDHRGKRLGIELLQLALSETKRALRQQLGFHVWAQNKSAISFYVAVGANLDIGSGALAEDVYFAGKINVC